MDALEDSWWPNSITELRPFTLPPSSHWVQRQHGEFLIIQAGGDVAEYCVHPDYLPFLMLLDMVQLTYLLTSNSGSVLHQDTFYKGVIFLDSLRKDFLGAVRNAFPGCESPRASVPESMRRWLCRLLSGIPHDPENRRRHAELLNKAYLEVDVFKHDFLDWSLTHEEALVSCLSMISNSIDITALYSLKPLPWLEVLRSQFVQVGLCTRLSLSRLGDSCEPSQSGDAQKIQVGADPMHISSSPELPITSLQGVSGSNLHPLDINASNSSLETMSTVGGSIALDMSTSCELSLPSPQGSKPFPPSKRASVSTSITEQSLPTPVHRGRGRPRRQAPKFPQPTPGVGPKRELRTRQNTKIVSKDPWAVLSNTPHLTPSPKKSHQTRAPHRHLHCPGSTKGHEMRLERNRQEHEAVALEAKKVTKPDSQVLTHPALNKNSETIDEPANQMEGASTLSEYFKYISTMSSFDDPYFKNTISKELLKDKRLSRGALRSLSLSSQNASATNWEKLKHDFALIVGSKNQRKARAIETLDRIYQKCKCTM